MSPRKNVLMVSLMVSFSSDTMILNTSFSKATINETLLDDQTCAIFIVNKLLEPKDIFFATPSPLRYLKLSQERLQILVMEGASFIGFHLVDRLRECGNNEVANNFFNELKDNLRKWINHPQKEYWCSINPIGIISHYNEGEHVVEKLMFDFKK